MSTELPPSKEPVAEADSELVQVQQHPTGAVLLTLNRPAALNALDLATLTALQSAVAAVRSAPDVTAVVITGQGRLFSAGIDLTDDTFQVGEASDVYRGKRILDRQHELIEDVAALPMPTIAAVNGHAVGGGGFGLMMACDIRLAVADAQMWLVPAALSVIQDFGVTWALQRALGTTRTWTLLATGERLGATEALQAGLLSEVFADQAALREGVETWLGHLHRFGAEPARITKTLLRVGASSSLPDQLRLESVANALTFLSPQFQERLDGFTRRVRR